MNTQAHPGLHQVGTPTGRAMRRTAKLPARRARVGRGTVGVLAAVVIEAIMAAAVVGMTAGLGTERHAVGTRPGAAPYITPAPEPAPTPAPAPD